MAGVKWLSETAICTSSDYELIMIKIKKIKNKNNCLTSVVREEITYHRAILWTHRQTDTEKQTQKVTEAERDRERQKIRQCEKRDRDRKTD